MPAEAGMNRFVWNMRYPDAESVPGAILWSGSTVGPTAPPGTYEVRLTADGKTMSQKWNWLKDPRLDTTDKDFADQFALLIRIRDTLGEVSRGINRLRSARSQIDAVAGRAAGAAGGAGERAKEIAAAARAELEKLGTILEKDVAAFNALVRDAGVPAVVIK